MICINCSNDNLNKNDFYIKDKKTQRYDTTCKECRKIEAKKWHQDNKKKSLLNKLKWHKENRQSQLVKFRKNYQRRIKENPQKEYEQRKKWNQENRDKINKNYRERYSIDINFKIGTRLRENTQRIIKKGCTKKCKTLEMLDCSLDFMKKWIEYQFDNNMNWNNWGSYWALDHFIPIASFDLTKKEEQYKCFHWSNHQPLEKKENNRKNDNIPSKKEITNHNQKISKFKLNRVEKHPTLDNKLYLEVNS